MAGASAIRSNLLVFSLSLLLAGAAALPKAADIDLDDNDFHSWIFVVGDGGHVIKSSNAGATWECTLCSKDDRMALTGGATLNAVHFFTSRLGFVVGDGGLILKTVNGGANWFKSETGVTNHLYGVHIFQPLVVYVVGTQGLVLTTDNGGDTWAKSSTIQIPHWSNGVMTAPTLRSIRFTDSRNGVLVGDCNKWFVTSDSGESWTSADLPGVPPSAYNGTAVLYLTMDRYANMIAVGRRGLVYTIARKIEANSDTATFEWTARNFPGQGQVRVDLHGASGYNASHFMAAGGPAGFVLVSTSTVGNLESSPIPTETFAPLGNDQSKRLTSVYTPSIYTSVVASDAGEIFVSNDMSNTWRKAKLPLQVPDNTRWLAMSGRNAHDEASAAYSISLGRGRIWLAPLAATCSALISFLAVSN